jgi:bifunctional non-homologous end joining protein LigD
MRHKLHFVVQQHNATHMHWDFRLEMDGVLVSWVLPKGPSTDPAVKRLAIRVGDHEYSYRNFEGVITGEQYGAGQVIIWDQGEYTPNIQDCGDTTNLHQSWLSRGTLEFTLHGQKLKGRWILLKTAKKLYDEDTWLLIKSNDNHAKTGDIVLERPESVMSGKTVTQITEEDGSLRGDTWDEVMNND